MTEARRQSLLAVMMLAILVAAVGAGWWLSASRRSDPQAALDVLSGIRRRGLRAIWGDKQVTNWYIERDADGPVGWSVTTRGRMEDGRYAGMRVRRTRAKEFTESWVLDDAARTGQYVATESRLILRQGQRMPMEGPRPTTKISLREGQVKVQRGSGRQTRSASRAAPDNYIPKGLTSLVMFETALLGRKTTFSILENSRALAGTKLTFSTFLAAPEGRRVVRVDHGNADEVMAFDETGQLRRTSHPGTGWWSEMSSADIVAKAFPEDKLTTALDRDGEPDEDAQGDGSEEF